MRSLLFFILFTPLYLFGVTLYVDDDTTQCPSAGYTSIENALNNSNSGDTIVICNGTYNENITISKNNITIKGQSGNRSDVIIQGGTSHLLTINSWLNFITVENITFKQNNSNEEALYINAVKDITIKNISIQTNRGNGLHFSGQTTRLILQNSNIQTISGGYGIYFSSSLTGLSEIHNVTLESYNTPLYVKGQVTDLNITNGKITSSQGDGIHFNGQSSRITIEDTSVKTTKSGKKALYFSSQINGNININNLTLESDDSTFHVGSNVNQPIKIDNSDFTSDNGYGLYFHGSVHDGITLNKLKIDSKNSSINIKGQTGSFALTNSQLLSSDNHGLSFESQTGTIDIEGSKIDSSQGKNGIYFTSPLNGTVTLTNTDLKSKETGIEIKSQANKHLAIKESNITSIDDYGIYFNSFAYSGVSLVNSNLISKKTSLYLKQDTGGLEATNSKIISTDEDGIYSKGQLGSSFIYNQTDIEAGKSALVFNGKTNVKVLLENGKLTSKKNGISFEKEANQGICLRNMTIDSKEYGIQTKSNVYGNGLEIENSKILSQKRAVYVQSKKQVNPIFENSTFYSSNSDTVYLQLKDWTSFTSTGNCFKSQGNKYGIDLQINKSNRVNVTNNCFYNDNPLYYGKSSKAGYNFTSNYWGGVNNYNSNNISDNNALTNCPHTCNFTNGSPPQISTNLFTVAENQTAVGNINATDPDGDVLIYWISGGDSSSLTIDGNGLLTFKNPPDYESKNTYSFTVHVDDGENEVTATVTINITDVNEAVDCNSFNFSFNSIENQIVSRSFPITITATCNDTGTMIDLNSVVLQYYNQSSTKIENLGTVDILKGNNSILTTQIKIPNGYLNGFLKATYNTSNSDSNPFDVLPKALSITNFQLINPNGHSFTYFGNTNQPATLTFDINGIDEAGDIVTNYDSNQIANNVNFTLNYIGTGNYDETYNYINTQVPSSDFTKGTAKVSIPINFNRDSKTPLNPLKLENGVLQIHGRDSVFNITAPVTNINNMTAEFFYGRINPVDGNGETDIIGKVYYEIFSSTNEGEASVDGGNWYQKRSDNTPVFSFGNYSRSDGGTVDATIIPKETFDSVTFIHPGTSRNVKVTINQETIGNYLYYNPYSKNNKTIFYMNFQQPTNNQNSNKDIVNNRGINFSSQGRLGE
ncbi:MAG: cadherin domain-containing protein [Campylobacterales bacterium]|nr:cadherin domain-containing protein [Campylobacterales bacterium]